MLKNPAKNEVFVYVSEANRNFTGHVSIEINSDDQIEYISFYSKDLASRTFSRTPCGHFLNSQGKLVHKEADCRHLDNAIRYEIQDLDTAAMYLKAAEFKKRITLCDRKKTESISSASIFAEEMGSFDEDDVILKKLSADALLSKENVEQNTALVRHELRFGIFGKHSHLCSTIVFELLEIGNIQKKIPYYANLIDPRHLFLLSLRPSISIVTLAPVFCLFLLPEEQNSNNEIFIASLALSTQLLVVVLCEHKYNKRSLVEISNANFVVKYFALLGFGAAGLASSYISREIDEIIEPRPVPKLAIDTIVWLLSSVCGFCVVGGLAATFVYALFGLRAVVRPSGVKCLLEYLDRTKGIPEEKLKLLFKRESTQLLMVVISMLGGFAFMEEIENPVAAYFLDGGFCLLIGCLLTVLINERFFSLEGDTDPVGLEASHDSRPVQFALMTYTTGAFVASIAYIMHNYVTKNVLVNSIMSIPSALCGYFLGAFLSSNLTNLSQLAPCRSNTLYQRLFGRTAYNSLAQESNDHYYNVEYAHDLPV